MSDVKTVALKVTQQALYAASPPLAGLMDMITDAIKASQKAGGEGQLPALQIEVQRQELMMNMAERQAKVTQELALAHRIETAQEVEMEEFYDLSGSGELGIKGEPKTFTAGLSARGQKVVKRVFRFKGHGSSSDSPSQVPS